MPICEHGHDHNIFVTGEVHQCRGCPICHELQCQIKQAPTNEDLLDTLIDNVLEYAVQDNPEERAHIPTRKESKLRELMTKSMSDWVHQVFRK